jgi:GWxTD domain-containing protein
MLAAAATANAATKSPSDEIIFAWRDGAPRYLMTTKEDQAVRAMTTVPELARFITAFWARRDPTPGTLENEYRRTYWSRVLEADRLFRDSTTPGWKTDRGKIYILLGAPDSVEMDDSPGFGAPGRSGAWGRRRRSRAGPQRQAGLEVGLHPKKSATAILNSSSPSCATPRSTGS